MNKIDLNSPLSLKTIQKSKRLQELGSMMYCGDNKHTEEWLEIYERSIHPCESDTRLTFTDIINNSRELFSNKYIATRQPGNIEVLECHLIAHTILDKIFSGEGMESLEKYILENINE